jgi:short-subunit dehydrogenase
MALPPPASDTTCLVTGASSGIGREIARQLAQRGHGVTLVARREDRLRAVADELAGAHGVRTEVIAADLTDPKARARVLEDVEARGLTVDVLINNAGFSTVGAVHRSDPERELVMVRTDVEAVADLCTRVLPGMVARGRGAVLNVASTAAFQPMPGQAGYSAAKAFVLAYSQAVRAELRGTGVTVTALCPGPVDTEFAEVAGFDHTQVASSVPRFMWVSVEQVAAEGLAGLERGKAVVVPGLANKAGALGGRLTPRSLLLPIIARQHPALREGN